MGLASKLQAAGAGGAPGGFPGAPPQQYGGAPAQGGQYPGQGQYQAYPGAQRYPSGQAPPVPGNRPPHQQNSSPYPPASSPYPPQNQYRPSSAQPPYPPSSSPYPPTPQQPSYGQQPPYGAPPQGYQPYGQQNPYGSPAPYQQTPNYGYGQQGHAPPQGGQYPPGGQQGYAQAPAAPAGPAQIAGFKQALQQCIQERGLQNFYPPNSPALDQLANKAAQQVGGLCQRWRIPAEIGNDLVKLGLYDIVIYIDDSGSMQFEEGGERIKDLRLILERVASVATIFDDDGISLRFMNANYDQRMLENIRSEQQIDQLMRSVQFKGLTPMGTELRSKVIDGIIVPKIRQGQYRKPTLVIMITDGQPAGEPQNAVFDAIKYASAEVSRQFGPGGVAFQVAQVGNDLKAREFLGKLDEDPVVGRLVDCTSNYENESEEMQRQGVNLTPELWLVKLLLGAIDSTYDRKDERPGGAPPPQQQGYGGPGGYPPQQQYGGYPPQGGQGGYPGQQGGYPPQQGGYPPQQGQGRGYTPYPPQGGQGGYGQPPAPPRY